MDPSVLTDSQGQPHLQGVHLMQSSPRALHAHCMWVIYSWISSNQMALGKQPYFKQCYGAALNSALLFFRADLSPQAGRSQRKGERSLVLNQFIPGLSILQHPAVPESPPKHRHMWVIARCWNGWLRNNSVPQLLGSTINHYSWLNNTKRD